MLRSFREEKVSEVGVTTDTEDKDIKEGLQVLIDDWLDWWWTGSNDSVWSWTRFQFFQDLQSFLDVLVLGVSCDSDLGHFFFPETVIVSNFSLEAKFVSLY